MASYLDRVNNLRNGTGDHLGGIKLEAGGTVFDDGDKDKLKGGKDQDWFLSGLSDQLKDKKSNELVDVL